MIQSEELRVMLTEYVLYDYGSCFWSFYTTSLLNVSS